MDNSDSQGTTFSYEFQKNPLEKVKVVVTEFKRTQVVDIRVYYEDRDKVGQWNPGKKGICMSVAHLDELLKALGAASEHVKTSGNKG